MSVRPIPRLFANVGQVMGACAVDFVTNEALLQGQPVALVPSAGLPRLVRADNDGAGTLPNVIGLSDAVHPVGDLVNVIRVGFGYVEDGVWDVIPTSADIGKLVYLSPTVGLLTLTQQPVARSVGVVALGDEGLLGVEVATLGGGGSAVTAVPTLLDKYRAPLASSGSDDFDTGLTISATPFAGGYIAVLVNGVGYRVAQSNLQRTTSVFYFGTVAGTAIAMASVVAFKKLFFNPSVAGFDLTTGDRIDINYEAIGGGGFS